MLSNLTLKQELSLMGSVNQMILQFALYKTIYKYFRNIKYLLLYPQIYIIFYWLQKCVKKNQQIYLQIYIEIITKHVLLGRGFNIQKYRAQNKSHNKVCCPLILAPCSVTNLPSLCVCLPTSCVAVVKISGIIYETRVRNESITLLSFQFKSLYVPSLHVQVIFIVSVANVMFFMC